MSPAEEAWRYRLIAQLMDLPAEDLMEVEALLRRLRQPTPQEPTPTKSVDLDWAHAPLHRLTEHGTYFVTTGTLLQAQVYRLRCRSQS